MLSSISIRWRITLFHIITLLAIAGLLMLGMFAVFGIAASNFVEAEARSRANEAARIVEHTGTLSPDDLVALNRDSVFIMALDAEGRVVSQIGAGLTIGEVVPRAIWGETAETGQGSSSGERQVFQRWNDDANYVHVEPVDVSGPIRFVVAGVNYDTVGQQQYMWVTFAFVGFGVLAFVLITIGSIFLVRYSLAPVKAIAAAAEAISEDDLSQRLPVRSGRDELGQLAHTFNGLLGRLETAFNEREEVLAHQRRFVADASHELRTPLTSLLGYTRLLQRWGSERPEATSEALERMESEAVRMQSLVEGLLQLARNDEASDLHLENIDLASLAMDVVDAAMMGVSERSITLDVSASLPLVQGDQLALRQVLTIVLDNALKYSPDRSDVSVIVDAQGAGARIQVRNAGDGIAPEHVPHVFERFYRAESSRSSPGSGLGLAIARDLMLRQGGEISLESAPGEGCLVTVSLPQGDRLTLNAT